MKPSDFLRDLADKIDRNPETDFGGCFAIIPSSGAEPVSGFFIGKPDPMAFMAIIKTKLDVLLSEMDAQQKNQQVFGRR